MGSGERASGIPPATAICQQHHTSASYRCKARAGGLRTPCPCLYAPGQTKPQRIPDYFVDIHKQQARNRTQILLCQPRQFAFDPGLGGEEAIRNTLTADKKLRPCENRAIGPLDMRLPAGDWIDATGEWGGQ